MHRGRRNPGRCVARCEGGVRGALAGLGELVECKAALVRVAGQHGADHLWQNLCL